ncbi:hypothetical protein SS50377_27132 [Spironucleus salmonicida]|uniref:Uncharacterized protein n=1 Tax=Spironucleus salmonicida TaxID=348837 RepID=V6LGS1_9EUKA|nr:hypothetical protein SS50377_27132 [Spironucleus salmonicida]|eukprot:EST43740.1 Hypothetical protein SS50377_16472 [Spironucleus salmonicida]
MVKCIHHATPLYGLVQVVTAYRYLLHSNQYMLHTAQTRLVGTIRSDRHTFAWQQDDLKLLHYQSARATPLGTEWQDYRWICWPRRVCSLLITMLVEISKLGCRLGHEPLLGNMMRTSLPSICKLLNGMQGNFWATTGSLHPSLVDSSALAALERKYEYGLKSAWTDWYFVLVIISPCKSNRKLMAVRFIAGVSVQN